VHRYHEPDERDYKLFGIGAWVFGMRRPWPIQTYEDKRGEPFAPGPELAAMARSCQRDSASIRTGSKW
jgi:hypothetical protein